MKMTDITFENIKSIVLSLVEAIPDQIFSEDFSSRKSGENEKVRSNKKVFRRKFLSTCLKKLDFPEKSAPISNDTTEERTPTTALVQSSEIESIVDLETFWAQTFFKSDPIGKSLSALLDWSAVRAPNPKEKNDFLEKLVQSPKCLICREKVWIVNGVHSNSKDKLRNMAKHLFQTHFVEEMKLDLLNKQISKEISDLLKCPCPRGRGLCKVLAKSYKGTSTNYVNILIMRLHGLHPAKYLKGRRGIFKKLIIRFLFMPQKLIRFAC